MERDANHTRKRAGVAILISDKIDFKSETVIRQRISLYNDKRANKERIYNNYKYLDYK